MAACVPSDMCPMSFYLMFSLYFLRQHGSDLTKYNQVCFCRLQMLVVEA